MHGFTFTCEHIIHVFEYESSTLEPGLQVCIEHRHDHDVELCEGVFRVRYGRARMNRI